MGEQAVHGPDGGPEAADRPPGLTLAGDVVDDLLAAVSLTPRAEQLARRFAKYVELHQVASGRSPTVVAASCVYVAANVAPGRPLSQAALAEAADEATDGGCSVAGIQGSYEAVARALDGADAAADAAVDLRAIYAGDRLTDRAGGDAPAADGANGGATT